MNNPPTILLINPWIHDFAAYDFWAKPLGLLTLTAILRIHGAHVSYVDCLNRNHPFSKTNSMISSYGRGPYKKTRILKPVALKNIPRNYCRYGILPDWFEHDIKNSPKPDIIMISCMMTYWYPGTVETIATIKNIYPDVPIVLGGIYPTLCRKHAIENSGADLVVTGAAEDSIFPLISKLTNWRPTLKFNSSDLNTYPVPAFDLQHKIDYIPILTQKGCPYNCSYCASNFLQPNIMHRNYKSVVNEILYWHKTYKITEFVFYDDAFLLDSPNHSAPILEQIIKLNIGANFHTPNALHIRGISYKIAKLMFLAGFRAIRLGLETANFKNRQNIDKKVTYEELTRAVRYLIRAGFKKTQIGVYLLVGLPKQGKSEVIYSINVVKKLELTPILAHYSPIPHTSMWDEAVATSRYDLESDPIFTNNAISPCTSTPFSWKTLSELKEMTQRQ